MESTRINGENLKNLNRLRSIAIILVIGYHLAQLFQRKDGFHILVFFQRSFSGVDIFVFLSAIGLSYAYYQKKFVLKNYFKKRLLTIYPAYWLALIFFALFNIFVYSDWIYYKYFLLELSGIQFVIYQKILNISTFDLINSSFWFISFIMIMYLIFPFVVRIMNKKYFNLLLFLLITSLCAITAYVSQNVFYLTFITRIPVFFGGMLFYNLLYKKNIGMKITIFSLLPPVAYLLARAVDFKYDILVNAALLPFAMAGIFLLFILMYNSFKLLRTTLNRISFFEKYSYELFLMHQPVISFTFVIVSAVISISFLQNVIFYIIYAAIIVLLSILLKKTSKRITELIRKII